MKELCSEFAYAYMDDIIVYSNSQEEHARHVSDILRRIKEFGFKIAAGKTTLFRRSVRYLGHIISEGMVTMAQDKVDVIKNWPVPDTAAKLHSFVSTVGFYKNFFGFEFVTRAKKLREMVQSQDMTWTSKRMAAFKGLKAMVTDKKFVSSPDWDKDFFLETDASGYAVGGVLYQYDSKLRKKPVMWMGRKLSPAESSYPTRDQELLALLYCVLRARRYLYGRHFTVRSDHLNLMYLYDNDIEGRLARWALKLSAYDMKIEHIKGKKNIVADGLSRMDYPSVASALTVMLAIGVDEYDDNIIPMSCRAPIPLSTKERDEMILKGMDRAEWNSWADDLDEEVIDKTAENLSRVYKLKIAGRSLAPWESIKEHTRAEKCMQPLFKHLDDPVANPIEDEATFKLNKMFAYEGGLLYWKGNNKGGVLDNKDEWKVYIPEVMRRTTLALTHAAPLAGHMGRDRLVKLLKDRFYWPNMTKDASKFVDSCLRCKISKTPTPKAGHLGEYGISEMPMDTIHIDHVDGFPESPAGNKHILTVIDRCSDFILAIPVPNLLAQTTARVLYDSVFMHYGIPRKIVSDNGSSFKNELINEQLAKRLQIKWKFCTPYNPRCNGKVEIIHKSMKATLRAYCADQPHRWESIIQSWTFAMNTAPSVRRVGYTPFQIMYGRVHRLPVDLIATDTQLRSIDDIVVQMSDLRAEAQGMIKERYEAILRKKQKSQEDTGTKHKEFEVGSFVLLYNDSVVQGIARKLQPRWEGPYTLLKQVGAYTYAILRRGKEKVVHARRLIPFQPYLLPDFTGEEAKEPEQKSQVEAEGAPEAEDQEEKAWQDLDMDLAEIEDLGLSEEEAKEKGLVVDKFYFLKNVNKDLLLVRLMTIDPLAVQFYRSNDKESTGRRRYFVPTWYDTREKLEDWTEKKSRPDRYIPVSKVVKPGELEAIGAFSLTDSSYDGPTAGGRIPAAQYKLALAIIKDYQKVYKDFCPHVGGSVAAKKVSSRSFLKPKEDGSPDVPAPAKKRKVQEPEVRVPSSHSMRTRAKRIALVGSHRQVYAPVLNELLGSAPLLNYHRILSFARKCDFRY